MKPPQFQSRREQGITPHRFDYGDYKDGLYLSCSLPDLYPATSVTRSEPGSRFFDMSETSWGWIEFLANSNRRFIDEVFLSVRDFRDSHSAPCGFAKDFQYLPHPPFPTWSLHLPFPTFPDLESCWPSIGNFPVEGGFSFLDPNSFWAIYGQHLPDYGITSLGIQSHSFYPSDAFYQAVNHLTAVHDLCLVDWSKLCIVPTEDKSAFDNWMTPYI